MTQEVGNVLPQQVIDALTGPKRLNNNPYYRNFFPEKPKNQPQRFPVNNNMPKYQFQQPLMEPDNFQRFPPEWVQNRQQQPQRFQLQPQAAIPRQQNNNNWQQQLKAGPQNLQSVLAEDSANKRIAFQRLYDRINELTLSSVRINQTLLKLTTIMIDTLTGMDMTGVANQTEQIVNTIRTIMANGSTTPKVLNQIEGNNTKLLQDLQRHHAKSIQEIEASMQKIFAGQNAL